MPIYAKVHCGRHQNHCGMRQGAARFERHIDARIRRDNIDCHQSETQETRQKRGQGMSKKPKQAAGMKVLGYIYGTILRVMENTLTVDEGLQMIRAVLEIDKETGKA